MPEHIVDCEHVPYGEGLLMVLPVSINGHVRETVVRCAECAHCATHENPVRHNRWLVCELRSEHHYRTRADGFCHHGVQRSRDA